MSEFHTMLQQIPEPVWPAMEIVQTRLLVALAHADESIDPSTQVGAFIVMEDALGNAKIQPEPNMHAAGKNGPPPTCDRAIDRIENGTASRDERLNSINHAETAAIADAAKRGIRTAGATLYAPWASCGPCACAIVAAGIKTVVMMDAFMSRTPERWQDSVGHGLRMMSDGGVDLRLYRGEDFDVCIKFDGEHIIV